MFHDHYVWFFWSIAFLITWLFVYVAVPRQRKAMLSGSLFAVLLGL